MRTTVTIDDDVAALLEAERQRTGETFREVLNRLLRKAVHRSGAVTGPDLPLLTGRPRVDITDVSAVLGHLDDERVRERRSV